MNITRKIGVETIMVNTRQANEIYFQKDTLEEFGIKDRTLTELDVCKILSYDDFHPILLDWELLDKCSFKCPFCYIVGHSHKKIVRFQQMKPALDKLINDGILYCLLTGGECTLHPDFTDIFTYLKTNGMIVEIYTNGSLITRNLIDVFKEYKPFKIEISVYGIMDKTFQANTESKHSSSLILENILLLKREGLNVVCKTPLNKMTLKEFEQIKSWCKENDISHYYSTDIFNAHDGDNLQDWSMPKELSTQFDAIKLLESSTQEELEDLTPSTPSIKQCFSCAVKKYGIHINAGFQLVPCSSFRVEEWKFDLIKLGYENALKAVRESVKPFFEKTVSDCIGCHASTFCKMCPAKAEPIKDKNGIIIDFKVPNGHCDKTREKTDMILEQLLIIK